MDDWNSLMTGGKQFFARSIVEYNIYNIYIYILKVTLTFQHVERDELPNKNKHTLTID